MILKRITAIILLNILIFMLFSITCSADNTFYAVENSNEIINRMQFNDVDVLGRDYWARDAVYTMTALGIIEGYGGSYFLPLSPVTRAEALTIIFRALSLENEADAYAEALSYERKNDPGTINNTDTWADGYIRLAYEYGLITKNQYDNAIRFDQDGLLEGEFNKTAAATRQEVAFWIAKLLKLTPAEGRSYINLNKFVDADFVDKDIAPYFDAVLNANIISGSNGYLNPQNSITRAEMTQILKNITPRILNSRGMAEYTGEIAPGTDKFNINVIRSSGIKDIITIRDGAVQLSKGLAVIGSGQIGGAELLSIGQKINYYVNNQNQVIFAKIIKEQTENTTNSSESYITSGIVQSINSSGRIITLYDESGKINPELYRKFALANLYELKILNNGAAAALNDIFPQDKVFLKVVNGQVEEISFSKVAESVFGTVTSKNYNYIYVLRDDGVTHRFVSKSSSALYKENKEISLSDIAVGSRVRITSTKVSDEEYAINTLVLQTDFSIGNLYKAVISSYDSVNSKLIVKELFKFSSGNWIYTPYKGFVTFQVDAFPDVYYDNEPITVGMINNYPGKEIYIAVKPGLDGEETVAFARINSLGNDEYSIYNGKMRSMDTKSRTLKLQRYSYEFLIGKGTLLIKNGMMIALNDISSNDDLYVAAMMSSDRMRNNTLVVYVDNSSETLGKYELIHGRVVTYTAGKSMVVEISRVYYLNQPDYTYYSRSKTFDLNSDTRILDNDGVVNNRNIGSFLSNGLNRFYANILVYDGTAVVISLGERPDYTLTAQVGSVSKENGNVTAFNMYNIKEYRDGQQQRDYIENQPLKVAKSTIYLKNGRVVLASDIEAGDTFTAFYEPVLGGKVALIINVN